MRRARHECGDELRSEVQPKLRPLLNERDVSEASESVWGEGTTPGLAIGTREMVRVEVLDQDPSRLEHVPISQAMFVIDAEGLVEDVNAVAEALVGYSRDELVGQRVSFLSTEIQIPSHHVRSFAAHMYHRTGREFTVDVLLCPHHAGSSIAFITARNSYERARHNNEVMQIVHDLKNPLATIALEMCLLEDKLVQADLKKAVIRVTQNVAYLDRLVQDLLDASSMEVDRFEVHRRPTELRSLIEHVIERSTATRDRARVFLQAPRQISLVLDELRIERVVANLLHNALKYAPSPSEVVIRLDVLQEVVRVSVMDGGPGLRPEETTLVFDKYRRATSSHGHDGQGLGLYVSKRIVEAHGGRIGVDSIQGVGSSFFFELPLPT